MGKYNEKIEDYSVWKTATPTPSAQALPFYAVEAGHFYAQPDYAVMRDYHDSYLFLYTIDGSAVLKSSNTSIKLGSGSAAVIDCHEPHHYYCENGRWEFIWFHIRGSAVKIFFDFLYPKEIFPVSIQKPQKFEPEAEELVYKIESSELTNSINISARLHELFNILIHDSLTTEKERDEGKYAQYVQTAVKNIHDNYDKMLTIEDIMENIPLSKYHFIRSFKRIIGTTPYNYLMNYRLNIAKVMLRTSEASVSEISARCGFLDTSNFIAQFKKNINQTPLEYRHYFAGKKG